MLTNSEHTLFAQRAIINLVARVLNFQGGKKWITYGDLADEISYPLPHSGNLFGSQIGKTLGVLGHMFDGVQIEGEKVPMLQALVVASKNHLPSDGLKEFDQTYPKLVTDKKRDFVQCEYEKIFNFGFKWRGVIEFLHLEDDVNEALRPRQSHRFNPFGSEGSPEHIALRDWIIANPSFFNLPEGTVGIPEYPLKSGDKVDVVFTTIDKQVLLGVEVKSSRSDIDDIRRGIFQCVKYSAVLTAEEIAENRNRDISCLLAVEGRLGIKLKNIAERIGISVAENCRNILGRRSAAGTILIFPSLKKSS